MKFKRASILSKNLKQLLNETCLKVSEVSDKTGIPRPTIYNLIAKIHEPRISLLENLAHFFDVTVSQLIGEIPLNFYDTPIPILKWEDFNVNDREFNIQISNETQYVSISNPEKKILFSLLVKNSNYPMYPFGSLLIFEKTSNYSNQDIILLSEDNTFPILKRIIIDGKNIYLKALVNDIPVKSFDIKQCNIYGILTEVRLKN